MSASPTFTASEAPRFTAAAPDLSISEAMSSVDADDATLTLTDANTSGKTPGGYVYWITVNDGSNDYRIGEGTLYLVRAS